MKRGRALIDPAAVMAVEVVAVAAMAAAEAMEVAAVAGVAIRTVIAVPRATTANRAGSDLRGISPTPGSPAEHLGWGGTVREGSEITNPRVRRHSCVQFDSCPFCLLTLWNSSGRDQPPATAGGSDYFRMAGVIFKVSRSLPRTTSTSYSCPAFISPSA